MCVYILCITIYIYILRTLLRTGHLDSPSYMSSTSMIRLEDPSRPQGKCFWNVAGTATCRTCTTAPHLCLSLQLQDSLQDFIGLLHFETHQGFPSLAPQKKRTHGRHICSSHVVPPPSFFRPVRWLSGCVGVSGCGRSGGRAVWLRRFDLWTLLDKRLRFCSLRSRGSTLCVFFKD